MSDSCMSRNMKVEPGYMEIISLGTAVAGHAKPHNEALHSRYLVHNAK